MSDLKNIVLNEVSYDIDGLSGLTDDIKQALLACFQNVAWIDEDGQDYYDILESCLFPDATVSYISCVYTQSRVVYTDTDLNDLKTDLVVTAHWSNGTTTTVSSNMYALSGTLTVGTSVVTVTFSQKTTTFNVTVDNGIPATYTKYDYVRIKSSSKNNVPSTRMILLKEYANLNVIGTEFKFKPITGFSSGSSIFGGRTESGHANSFAFYAETSTIAYHLHGVNGDPKPSYDSSEITTVHYTNTSQSPSSIRVNDETPLSIVWENNNTINSTLSLFTNLVPGSNMTLARTAEIGEIKIFDLNGDLINDYFPVLRNADNVIGMFDVVEQIFYTPSDSAYATVDNTNCYYEVGNWS